MPEVDLIIFDLDGTLVNSLPDIVSSTNHTLGALSLSPLSENEIRPLVGDGIRVLLERAISRQRSVDEALMERALKLYMDHHEDHCLDEVKLYEGVEEALRRFSTKKMAVASNKAFRFTSKILGGLGVGQYFNIVLGGDSLNVRKPDPQVVLHIMERVGVPPGRTLLVGDGPQDVECARRAGILSCAVSSGFRPVSEIDDADFLIANIGELVHVII